MGNRYCAESEEVMGFSMYSLFEIIEENLANNR